jgi:hypothetical protein
MESPAIFPFSCAFTHSTATSTWMQILQLSGISADKKCRPLAISIFFLYSRETSRIIITPRTMRWRQLSSPGFEKSRKNFSVTEWKNLLHVERNVLALTMNMLKNKYIVLKLKNCTLIYFLLDLAICFCSRFTSKCALLSAYLRIGMRVSVVCNIWPPDITDSSRWFHSFQLSWNIPSFISAVQIKQN